MPHVAESAADLLAQLRGIVSVGPAGLVVEDEARLQIGRAHV